MTKITASSRFPVLLWLALAGLAGLVIGAVQYQTVGGGLLIALALFVIFLWLLPKLVRKEDRRFALTVVLLAVLARFTATGIRWWMAEEVYGYGDSLAYSSVGGVIAQQIHLGEWAAAAEGLTLGTPLVEFLTGFLYAMIGFTSWGAFLVFSSLSLVGSLLFYRAFRIGFPQGNWKLFLVLVLFYPALLYWPSAIGKDSLVLLFSGLAAYGAALFCTRASAWGVAWSLIGITSAFLIRPSTALLLLLGLAAAVTVMRPTGSPRRWLAKHMAIVAVAGLSLFTVGISAQFLEFQSVSPRGVVDRLIVESNRNYDLTGAGSNFDLPAVTDPAWIPVAVITVLFRPFPWEAHNAQALAQSADGLVMLGVVSFGLVGLLTRRRTSLRHKSFLVYTLTIAVAMILVLGTLGNFGLLARQRATLLPYVFMGVSAVAVARIQVGRRPVAWNGHDRAVEVALPGYSGDQLQAPSASRAL